MKKYVVLILMIIFIAILGGIIYANSEKTVNGKEELYEKVEEYLVSLEEPNYFLESKDAELNYDISDFKVFTDIEKLGIKKRKNQFHVYVWAKVESYYVQDGKLVSNSGSAAPYEFIIENDVVIDYKKPKDGTEYTKNDNIKEILAKHIISPVRFDKILELMKKEHVDRFIEIGPGKALSGFVRKEMDNVEIYSINSIEALKKLN